MSKRKKRYVGPGAWIRKLRKSGIPVKDICKIVGLSHGTVKDAIYRDHSKYTYTLPENKNEYVKIYTKHLLKQIGIVSNLKGDELIGYIADKRQALFTQLGIIECDIMTCDIYDLKDLAMRKEKILKEIKTFKQKELL